MVWFHSCFTFLCSFLLSNPLLDITARIGQPGLPPAPLCCLTTTAGPSIIAVLLSPASCSLPSSLDYLLSSTALALFSPSRSIAAPSLTRLFPRSHTTLALYFILIPSSFRHFLRAVLLLSLSSRPFSPLFLLFLGSASRSISHQHARVLAQATILGLLSSVLSRPTAALRSSFLSASPPPLLLLLCWRHWSCTSHNTHTALCSASALSPCLTLASLRRLVVLSDAISNQHPSGCLIPSCAPNLLWPPFPCAILAPTLSLSLALAHALSAYQPPSHRLRQTRARSTTKQAGKRALLVPPPGRHRLFLVLSRSLL